MVSVSKNLWKVITGGIVFSLIFFSIFFNPGPVRAKTKASPEKGTVARNFYNPIMDHGADPWMIRYHGAYYMTMTTGNNVTIRRSKGITDIASGDKKVVWTPSGTPFRDIWAPELHYFNGHWYIYFAADRNGDNATHRMYVLQSKNANPFSSYRFMGKISSPSDQWAIDGTVLDLNGHLYFIWSGWAANSPGFPQNLYIAPMSNPWTISGKRVLISTPSYSWENSVAPINEGPEVLQHNGKTFVIYSANASWTNQYCLGMLTLKGDDPLKASSWVKNPKPVFQSTKQVFGPGHASFTTSENGKQNWIIYHAARYSGAGWDRNIRAQPFTWNRDGTPDFGQPVSPETKLPLPSGEVPGKIKYEPASTSQLSAAFSVNIPDNGLYDMYVRYENGTDSATQQNFSVNGRTRGTITYPRTGGSDKWSTLIKKVYLTHGKNTIRFDQGANGASVKFIEISRHAIKGSTRRDPRGPWTYEAENSIYHHAQVVNESNASGGKVVGHIDFPDSYVKFNDIRVPSAGTYTVTVRYDNGLGNAEDDVSVNGGSPIPLKLPSTGGWNSFKTVSFQVHLQAGFNAIQFTHDKNYAEIDHIQIARS